MAVRVSSFCRKRIDLSSGAEDHCDGAADCQNSGSVWPPVQGSHLGWFFSGDDAAGTNTAADSASCSLDDRVWDSLVNPISAAAGTDRTIFKRDLNAGPTPTSSAVPAFFYLGNVTGLFVICKLNPWWSETSARTIMLLAGRIWKKGACFLQKSEYNKLQER